MDIFENKVLCKNCGKEMKQIVVNRNGFNLRALECPKCKERIYHPLDEKEYEEFIKLKQKEFNVKMRMVGNSYAVSIPREIVDFMREQERKMNDMVRMCFEEFGKISLRFNVPENLKSSRVVGSKEVKIIKNGKPILHAKKFYDSAHPEKNKIEYFKEDGN